MQIVKPLLLSGILSATLLGHVHAAEWTVSVKNLTHGSYFTPLLVTAHSDSMQLFKAGETASAGLQAMAEGGDISELVSDLGGEDADTIANPASGLLAPGGSASAELDTAASHQYLSVVSMILPSNDAFIGLNAVKIPTQPGTYMYYVNAYDAGTEANDEVVTSNGGMPGAAGMPNPNIPGVGSGGTGVTSDEANMTVHIHRNVLGDTDSSAGLSDADSRIHRWLNPVAKVMVTVK